MRVWPESKRGLIGGLALASVACALSALTMLWPASEARAGACAMPTGVVMVVTPATTPIPRGEGILVQVGTDPTRSLGLARGILDAPGGGEREIVARLERDGRPTIALRAEALAPGLGRLVPERAPAAGTWRVVTSEGSVEVTFGAAPAQPGPGAPQLVSMERSMNTWHGPGGGGTTTAITAHTRSAIRAPAIGVIVYAVAPSAESPWLARPLSGQELGIVVYRSGGRCAFYLPGENPPSPGAQVRIAAYDLWGRVSPRSESVTVTGD